MRAPQVHWFYKRIKATNAQELIHFELAGSLSFLLRRFHFIQPETITILGVSYSFPIVGVEFIDGTGALRWQLNPIPAELYSAPRKNAVTFKTETTPADQSAYGVNMTAPFKPRSNTINLFYDVGEVVTVKLSGMEYQDPPKYFCPPFIDFAIEGVYIPNIPKPGNY